MRIHHVGYLVKNIKKSADVFRNLGYSPTGEVCHDHLRGVDILFIEKDGSMLELVCPFRDDSEVSGLMPKYKNSPYHICYEVDNLNTSAEQLRDNGFFPVDEEPMPAPAIENRPVWFLLHAQIGLIELVEKGDPQ